MLLFSYLVPELVRPKAYHDRMQKAVAVGGATTAAALLFEDRRQL